MPCWKMVAQRCYCRICRTGYLRNPETITAKGSKVKFDTKHFSRSRYVAQCLLPFSFTSLRCSVLSIALNIRGKDGNTTESCIDWSGRCTCSLSCPAMVYPRTQAGACPDKDQPVTDRGKLAPVTGRKSGGTSGPHRTLSYKQGGNKCCQTKARVAAVCP